MSTRIALWCALVLVATGCAYGTQEPLIPLDEPAPDFALLDVNTSSAHYDELVSPRDHLGVVSAWYFAHSYCPNDSEQLTYLDTLQRELDDSAIRILGVNGLGYDGSSYGATYEVDVPWLRPTLDDNPWRTWEPVRRDLIVLDAENKPLFVYNLKSNDLEKSGRYDELKALLEDAAAP